MSAEVFKSLGFSRMVVPREITAENLRILCEKSPIETELFIHGALCVCHSGQCLMSSMIGGRSGNRGECAQPCRLPYNTKGNKYPLSLKDLCLAGKIGEIITTGVSSLKIEGRMKNRDYVYGVTQIYRRLLDERRDAEPEEIEELARLFSRSGFTCGYYENKKDRDMLGVRTEVDKRESAQSTGAAIPEKKIPIKLTAEFKSGCPAKLTGGAQICGAYTVRTVEGEKVERAEGRAMSEERVKASLGKLGGTVFTTTDDDITLNIDDTASMPVSAINALRRALCDELLNSVEKREQQTRKQIPNIQKIKTSKRIKTAVFTNANSIPYDAKNFFDRIFVPAAELEIAVKKIGTENLGIAFTPVAFDNELENFYSSAEKAAELGCKYALITGLWQIPTAKRLGFEMTGDLRLNCCNSHSVSALKKLGINNVIISVETGLVKAGKISESSGLSTVVYGRIPLMTLEKCVIRDIMGLKAPTTECHFCDGGRFTPLIDRTGAEFILCREENHRNVLYNSVPVWMADKRSAVNDAGLSEHYIFTDEDETKVKNIIASFVRGDVARGAFRRI
ncbi:MAG: U32 family peptidase [Clostridia bacterium]|nr:U32 family peptidase [Clostridia bacterium]